MGRSISLFSGYGQGENRTTNYCLLILKMLYEENPKFLAEVLSSLINEDVGDLVGVGFGQQEKRASTTPDGLIWQRPFTIYIETKNYDWFYDQQLEGHLKALSNDETGFKILLALGNFEGTQEDRFERIQKLCRDTYGGGIVFSAVSFEDLLQAMPMDHLPKNLSDAVADFRGYLDESGLLPTWKGRLDVVNCAGIPEEVLEGNVYMCPATGGAYNHQRSKYFGMYRNKRVEYVAQIEAVLDVESDDNVKVKWKNGSGDAEELGALARTRVSELRPGRYPTRVFVLGQLHPTDFEKNTPGGMFTSKQYFDVSSLKAVDAGDLAEKLRGKTWAEISLAGS